ncbi:SDR family NAD(P)-dependent oxidoreductase [Paenarthrobacter nitroguajacolicus]|uniref:SDR family NAD(P)-dependent oxidoreductase n=1 Tax=Paenarthrobacter nitroguajacolicus TaxID=211146 RepID=UPI00248AED50|nr:SDR family oxidoreductase [Paenarthrobacter nitroguajacolicus]MDI2036456.1 2-(R)-hydroxypropyl-CoM dehydrogenase [Paenarthrobacter nitroguajacolicus]
MTTHPGKIAAVTGAASGNGLAIAGKLLKEGATVVALDRDEAALERLVAQHPEMVPVVMDVANEASVHSGMAEIDAKFGRLDTLVNNAGIVKGSNFDDLGVAEWDQVFAVNSTGPFLVSQAARPLLEKGAAARGDDSTSAIVNITSVEAHIVIASSGHPQVHYNASKGALLMFTKALAIETAASKIRVNAVAPGFIETPFTKSVLENQEAVKFLLDRTPLGRIGRPSDVANAVAFLASDEASWVTGTTIHVDGGWLVY